MPRVKLLTSNVYSPTNPASEAAIREQIDSSIQEVYDAAEKVGESVKLTTDQTIAGVKTFSSSPIVPTPTLPTQAATKGYVDGVAISATVPLDSITDDYLSSTAGQIKPRVATLETDFATAQSDINTLETDVGTIETDLNILRTAKVTTGSNVALAVDTDGTFDMTRNGNTLTVIPNVANTGAMTIAVDGQTARAIQKANDAGTLVALEAGDIKQNVPVQLVLQTSGTPVFIYAPKGGSNIKSIQKGTTSLIGVASVTQSITSVDLNKSVVIIFPAESGGTQLNQILTLAKFLNSTTLEFSKGVTTGLVGVEWQVIEFNNVKSKQSGDVSITTTTTNASITTVNLNKSILYGTFKSNTTLTTIAFVQVGYKLTNATTLTVLAGNSSNTGTAHYQVIEFN